MLNMKGFIFLVYNECRKTIKASIPSYFWFILLISISTYSLSIEKYAEISIDRSLLTLKTGGSPTADVLLFITSFAVSSTSDVISGKAPQIVFPASIGVIFFMIFPMMLGLTLMSKFIIKKSTASIAGEKEKKTLYLLASSPLTRSAIYTGKFAGIFLLTLPMIFFIYLASLWVFAGIFSSAPDLSKKILETSAITAFFFISAGMLLSVTLKHEKNAAWAGTKIVTAAALLTTAWLTLPFLEFLMNLTNNRTDFLTYFEKITIVSPFTLDLMSVHSPATSEINLGILIIASFIFFISGMVMFTGQDIEA